MKVIQEHTPKPRYLVQDAYHDSRWFNTVYKGEFFTLEEAQAKYDALIKQNPMKKIRIVEV